MNTNARTVCIVLLSAILAVPVGAAEGHKYLPNDTESVQVVSFRKGLDSAIGKKHLVERLKEALKSSDEVGKVLADLAFDPLKDLDAYIQTNGGGDKVENVLYILQGRFNAAKFHAKAAETIKEHPTILKSEKVKKETLYEVVLPFPLPPHLGSAWVALVDDKTLVGSFSKDYMLEVLDKKAGTKKTALGKDFKAVLEKTDDKQAFWLAALPGAFLKGPIKDQPDLKPVVDFLEKTRSVSGGIAIDDGIKAEFTLVFKDADSAKEAATLIEKGLAAAKAEGDDMQKAIVAALLGAVKVKTKDATLTLSGLADVKAIEKILSKL